MIGKRNIVLVALTVVLTAGLVHADADLGRQVHRELIGLPYTGIWDWIEADVHPDGTVILTGDVTRQSIKNDAEFRIRRIEGVTKVVDDLHLLPLSQFDNQIRLKVYRSLFNRNSTLSGYALGANPSIHIIVNNGNVTLKGVVSNAMDKQLAGVAANGVSGVFKVENDLQVESRS